MGTIFARRGYFDSFSPGLGMISRFAGCKWQQTGTQDGHLNFCFLPWGAVRGLQRRERWEGKQVNPSGEEREWQCGRSVASKSLMPCTDCSKERRQVFPNLGAPTWLWKPHPSAHRLPALLQNQWDTLGSCPGFWKHRCKNCLSPWWMFEHKHGVAQSCHTELQICFLFF